ncbi:TOTE conflict system archaeo-eukaryotic primase domain-containing protein [Bacillota bacterium LCP21S3_D8]
MAFRSCRKEDLYDPDQGARIEHPTITREMLSLFYKWFHGRPDVYARRGKKGGYYPQCANRWSEKCPFQNGSSRYCLKNQCPVRKWIPLTGKIILSHLLGKSKFGDDAIGVYPLFDDDTCHFLVFDFDHHKDNAERADGANEGERWKDEVDALRLMCRNNHIDCLVERSRSGRGAHVWIFFAGKVKASVARAFGYGLLERGAKSINLLSFDYYDRMYPSQDCSDSIGNLIALPLQGLALKDGNSAFVDENWNACPDQWAQLTQRRRYTEPELIAMLAQWQAEEGPMSASGRYAVVNLGQNRLRPWENRSCFRKEDITGPLHIVLADGIYVDALNLKPGIQNQIRSLASFTNPVFQENKAMGHSNHATARIQYLGQDTDGYIRIPRGLLEQLENKCREAGIAVDLQNKRSCGRPVRVSFRQELYLQQDLAAQRLLQFDDGILSAATAFGKTAVCSYLISRRKVSTLVLLRSKALMNQWLEEFSILQWWIHYAGRKTFRICSKHMGWSLWTNVIMELPQVRRRY